MLMAEYNHGVMAQIPGFPEACSDECTPDALLPVVGVNGNRSKRQSFMRRGIVFNADLCKKDMPADLPGC